MGVVEACGDGARRFALGERVGVPWLYSTCGACAACRRGDENLCNDACFTGYHVDGGYATHAVVPEGFAYGLPGGLTDAQAAPLLCAGIIGYRALCLADVKPGDRLGLIGFGASAHIAIQVARFWGCDVLVFTRSLEHRALAKALGASWVGGTDDEPPGLLDRAISFAPAGGVIPLALAKLRKGGTLALAGIHLDKIPEMPYSLLYGEPTLRSVFPPEEANAALRRLKTSGISGAGVLRIE